MAERKKKAPGEKPAAKKPAARKKKAVPAEHHEPGHLSLKSLTIRDPDSKGHSIHMRAADDIAGLWLCGPTYGECLALVSIGDQQPYVCIYGGPKGYDAPPVAIQVSREDGDVLIQTVDAQGNPQFIRLSDVINASGAQSLLSALPPKGFNPVAFAPPPHEEAPPKPDEKQETQEAQKIAGHDPAGAGSGGGKGQQTGEETP